MCDWRVRKRPASTKRLGTRPLQNYRFRSEAISANRARAAWRSSTISAAIMSGSGRLALSSEAFILTQDVEVDFVAHRNASSNIKNLRRDPIPPPTSQGGKHPSQLSALQREA